MSSPPEFAHLHLHSEYSLLDGAIRAADLARRTAELGMKAVALTDHGCLFGAVEFHRAMRDEGIKPILGMEAYMSPTRMDDRDLPPGKSPYHHLTLLARDETGYRNLCRLSSMGYLEGFYYKPRIDRELLAANCDGLAIGSACLHGEVAQHLLAGNESLAEEAVHFYTDLVGRDNFFLELMDHGLEDEKAILRPLADLAKRTGALAAATGDAHYLLRGDAEAHEVLLCVQTGRRLEDPSRLRFGSPEFYVKSPEEMQTLFSWIPESVPNTARIAERCEFRLEKGKPLLPVFPLPEGVGMEAFLRDRAFQGLAVRLHRGPSTVEIERLDRELSVIEEMGFPGYFLIVSELREWARSRGIAMGPGRGSAAGSLVSYAMGITDINPLEHGLSFDRFLNSSRREMPDIDLDFCFLRRPEVIGHITEMYGSRSVCQIVTFNRMRAKSSIREVGRAMGLPLDETDRLARLVGQAQESDPGIRKAVEQVPQLAAKAMEDPRIARLFDYCEFLENLARNTSVHAAGVIVAPGDLLDYVPLCRAKEEKTTQYEMNSLDSVGLLKLDVLGLRTVTVLQEAEKLVRGRGIDIELSDLPLDDPVTLAMLAAGDTTGVFQLESSGMRDTLKRIGVSSFNDITAAVAIFRPGSMDMIEPYSRNKHQIGTAGPGAVRYAHPVLEEVLSETYGVMIYQEQVIAIANRFAGMAMADADILRKAMSKKRPEVMAEQRTRFVNGAVGRGVPQKAAAEVWDQIEKFAGYGFNKSHAVCYAMLAYRTAYLKAHHPVEFLAATMTSETGDIERLRTLVEECRKTGVEILPPSVNSSGRGFAVDDQGRVIYALSAIRNVGEGPSAEIVSERERNGPYSSLFDLCSRIQSGTLNRRVLESLGGAGALDCLGESRARLLAGLDSALEYASRARMLREAGQMSLFCEQASYDAQTEPCLPDAPDLSSNARLNLEKALLGFYFSGHPLDDYGETVAAFADAEPGDDLPQAGRRLRMAGIVAVRREIPTARGNMAFVTLEGRSGSAELVVFNEALQKNASLLEPGSFVLCEGEVVDRRDERRLSVAAVYPIEQVRSILGAGVEVRIETAGIVQGRLESAIGLLRSRPGNGRVFLDIRHPSGWRVRAASRTILVEPDDDLVSGLKKILGDDSVRLVAGG